MTAVEGLARANSLEDWATRTPEALALKESGRALSYGEWNAAANRLAEVFHRRARVGPGDRVAVCTQNRLEWFVAQAAIGKLGATLVPISQRLTPAEVHYIAADSGAVAFVFDAEDADAMARVWTNEPKLDVDSTVRLALAVVRSERRDVSSFAEASAQGPIIERFSAGYTASIVYTSGTTGRPRGVVLGRAPGRKKGDGPPAGPPRDPSVVPRNLLGAPLNHAAGQASARATHQAGGTVFLMPRFDAEEALRVIARERITTTFLVPTMLHRIVSLSPAELAAHDVSSIRVIATGASPCPQDIKEKVIAYFGDHCLVESYGSTEVGLVSRMSPGDHRRKPGSCGRLLEGVELRIVGAGGVPVPTGDVGEIRVRTPVMIQRYLNRGAPDELVDGFFATGDVGRIDADGYLYILDRQKDMIIAGGVNIYPAEIEAALRKHPSVFDAAAFGVPHPEWGEEVRAAVERAPGRAVSEDELLAFVSTELAHYKRPRRIDFVKELPRNAAGKVLKATLREPHWKATGRLI